MKTAWAPLIAGLLMLGVGCVKQPDWIESTLVTVDVTGVWFGTVYAAPTCVFVPRKSSRSRLRKRARGSRERFYRAKSDEPSTDEWGAISSASL